MQPPLILYGTLGCHLCELAEACVTPIAQAAQLDLSLVDIAEHEGLEAYEMRIPVLKRGQNELDWPFDVTAVTRFIKHTKNLN